MILSMLLDGALVRREVSDVTFDLSCDVLCVGAGAAGCYAADAAAREGADVILLEYGRNIGGMPVCGGVTGYYYGTRGGAYEEDDEARTCLLPFPEVHARPSARRVSFPCYIHNT